ncbi:unnamed protein product [Clavelina lepadiformis]|uniref:RING-type E3 ubiquitin transferase n=1 Tax=Clavelina lepadiformis TaxID=159417 RepID=A0ABP0GX73_CLALP
MGGKQSSNASTSGLQTQQAEPPPGPSSSNRMPHGARRSTVTIGSLGQQHRRQMFGHNQSENYVLFDAHLSRTNSNNETGLQIPRRGFEWLYTNHHEDSDSSPDDDTSASRIFARAFSQRNPARSLPPYLISPMRDARCPMCGKMIPAEDVEVHFVMCLTKPRVTYNGKFRV